MNSAYITLIMTKTGSTITNHTPSAISEFFLLLLFAGTLAVFGAGSFRFLRGNPLHHPFFAYIIIFQRSLVLQS
jgi:hypothetical protein